MRIVVIGAIGALQAHIADVRGLARAQLRELP